LNWNISPHLSCYPPKCRNKDKNLPNGRPNSVIVFTFCAKPCNKRSAQALFLFTKPILHGKIGFALGILAQCQQAVKGVLKNIYLFFAG